MKQYKISECRDKIRLIGRTYLDTEQEIVYFNWTCSGMEFEFTGNYLLAQFYAVSAVEYDGIPPIAPERRVWPWIAVFLDNVEVPIRRLEISAEQETAIIFASEKIETHKIRIIKLSENAKGKVGISSFFMEGSITNSIPNAEKRKCIEFIGDSITCGFGNETQEKERFFYPGEENGWMSHAAVAARILHADISMICVSGITVGEGIGKIKWPLIPMRSLYPYTDRLYEENQKKSNFTEWDFNQWIPDFIVINLGTNDSTVISLEGDNRKGELNFEKNYYEFLQLVRRLNGPKPVLLCTLGSMDYYLYANLEKVVEKYSKDTKDTRVTCFKYGKIKLQEGYGACGHPSMSTQTRMGTELADFIGQLDLFIE
jgi:lysophospholipase L1-like esterase